MVGGLGAAVWALLFAAVCAAIVPSAPQAQRPAKHAVFMNDLRSVLMPAIIRVLALRVNHFAPSVSPSF
jgi:hypothetical protein